VELEVLHNLAITRHVRDEVSWVRQPRELLLAAWLNSAALGLGEVANAHAAVTVPAMAALRPSLLGDSMLRALDDLPPRYLGPSPAGEAIVEAWLCARWGRDGHSLNLMEQSRVIAEQPMSTQQAELEQVLRCLRSVARLPGEGALSRQVLRWALNQLWPATQDKPTQRPGAPYGGTDSSSEKAMPSAVALKLGHALCDLPRADLDVALKPLGTQMQGSGLPLVLALVSYGAYGATVRTAAAITGLGWADTLTLCRFATRRTVAKLFPQLLS
jgi:hypothetical protein